MSLEAAADLMFRMDDAPKPKLRTFDPPPGHFWCACSKKSVPLQKMKFCNTKFVAGCTDSLCAECEPMVIGMAKIVCIQCKSVVARIQPVKTSTGFRVVAGESYHTNACPNCSKDIQVSVILEKYFYDRENGFSVKPLVK